MQCPHDHSALEYRQKENVVGHVCKACQGIFLTAKGVKWFKLNYETDVLAAIPKDCLVVKSAICCPNCNSTMSLVNVDGIEIDVCKHCTGIWFDLDEVAKIIERYGSNKGQEKEGWDVLGDVLSWLIGIGL